ncbi:MAG TPA: PKD domain-containing protein [Anaeromyxobacteraceae bacterium]|nr:PKD domain-containing protein [Anaeromyxobacteraceae bacterium]
MKGARSIVLALLAAAAACTCSTAPPPALQAVDPVESPDHLDAALRITGRHFAPETRIDFDDPARSRVDGAFRAALVSGPTRIPLAGVTLLSGGEIQATLPAGAPVGTYDLEVVDPRGRVALLPGAFSVFVAECLAIQAPCDDGSLCTADDVCLGWRCRGGTAVVCPPPAACQLAGTCDPATGLCAYPDAENGTPCQVTCFAGDTCQAGACTPAPGGCLDTAPRARLAVTPGGGTAGATLFTLDASASSDAEDPASALRFRFDADGDGAWEGSFSSVPVLDHRYAAPGVYTAAVEVLDSAGLSGRATVLVVVAAPGDEVQVTTALDEANPNATPSEPGGTGLSLREAVAWVNAQRAPLTITLAAPLDVAMSGTQGLVLAASNAAVVGEPGVTLDFGGLGGACIQLDRPGQRLVGVTIAGCTGTFVSTSGPGSQVAQVTVVGVGGTAIGIEGLADLAGPSASSRIGPGNDLSGLATAVNLLGSDYEVVGNRLHGNLIGCEVHGGRASLHQNVFARQTIVPAVPASGVGLLVHTGPGPVEVFHDTFDRNEGDGLRSSVVDDLRIRNGLFTGNGGYGVNGLAAGLTLDHDGFFANALGPVSAELSTGPTDVLLDPLYVDGPGGDLRLLPASPAVDAALDTGLDVNGPGPGRYDGLAPDLGAEESPY